MGLGNFCVIQYRYLPMEHYDGHPNIEVDPLIRFGKPRIKGTRITVGDVLHWLAAGMTVEEIMEDFPTVTAENVIEVLAYAADRFDKTYVKWSTSKLVLPDPPYRQDGSASTEID